MAREKSDQGNVAKITGEALLEQYAIAELKVIQWLMSFGGQLGNFGHETDLSSAALIARIATTIKDEQLRRTVLQGVNGFVSRWTNVFPGQSACQALVQSIEQSASEQVGWSSSMKLDAGVQLGQCVRDGNISEEQAKTADEALQRIPTAPVLKAPGAGPDVPSG